MDIIDFMEMCVNGATEYTITASRDHFHFKLNKPALWLNLFFFFAAAAFVSSWSQALLTCVCFVGTEYCAVGMPEDS